MSKKKESAEDKKERVVAAQIDKSIYFIKQHKENNTRRTQRVERPTGKVRSSVMMVVLFVIFSLMADEKMQLSVFVRQEKDDMIGLALDNTAIMPSSSPSKREDTRIPTYTGEETSRGREDTRIPGYTGEETSSGRAEDTATAKSTPDSDPMHTECLEVRGSSGTWYNDWDYANRTNYPIHGSYGSFHLAEQNFTSTPGVQPFRLATAWRWQDDSSCAVTETSKDGFCQTCYSLGITRVLVLGDSLSMEFRHSLLSLLGSPPVGRQFSFNGCTKPTSILCESNGHNNDNPSFRFTITILWYRRSPLAEFEALTSPLDNTTSQSQFVSGNPNRTAIVANLGAWLENLDRYRSAFDALVQWIDSFDPTKIEVFYRETIPGHWPCDPGKDRVLGDVNSFNWINPVNVTPFASYNEYRVALDRNGSKYSNWAEFESYNDYSKRSISNRTEEKVKIHWLNIFNSSVLRRDGHVGFSDCLHYYIPGPVDWWVHFFYSALLDVSKLSRRARE
jgi:hypothetical protein